MIHLKKVHHIAIICSDYVHSKKFYTEILGFEILREVYRAERKSYKLDLALHGIFTVELFSFPNPPVRPSWPEAAGLRHLAFEVEDVAATISSLRAWGIMTEDVRTDEHTGKRFSFLRTPTAFHWKFMKYEEHRKPPAFTLLLKVPPLF